MRATELQRAEHGKTLYVLDEPTTVRNQDEIIPKLRQILKLLGNFV